MTWEAVALGEGGKIENMSAEISIVGFGSYFFKNGTKAAKE